MSPDAARLVSERVALDLAICGGRPHIRGMRVKIADMLAEGATRDDILADYPYLAADDLTAAMAYAAVRS